MVLIALCDRRRHLRSLARLLRVCRETGNRTLSIEWLLGELSSADRNKKAQQNMFRVFKIQGLMNHFYKMATESG